MRSTSGARPAWLAAIGIALGCLAWGVIVATYSSIFSAASLLAILGVNRDAIQIQPSGSKAAAARP